MSTLDRLTNPAQQLFRESLEAALIVSVLLALIERTVESTEGQAGSVQTKKLVKRLSRQVSYLTLSLLYCSLIALTGLRGSFNGICGSHCNASRLSSGPSDAYD